MSTKRLLGKNIWTIFLIVFLTSLVLFSGITYYSWTAIKQTELNKQQTHVELFGNSVRAFLESQESLLEVLGVHLIAQHQFPEKPIHDTVLDNSMDTYPAFLGLGLVAYDGRALVTSSNFDLSKLPNLMKLDQTRESFSQARESRKIHTGFTYLINALETQTYAMPIRRAIYIPHDAPQAVAVMTAGIKLDNTPIFGGHAKEAEYHQVEIIRSDKYPVFTTDDNTDYAKPVSESYYAALKKYTNNEQYFGIFDFDFQEAGDTYQIVSHYDAYLDFWFVSKLDKQYIIDIFAKKLFFISIIFVLYNLVLFLLTRSIVNTEKRTKKDLIHLAHHDPLTGLPNRSFLLQKLQHTINTSHRHNRYHAVLFLDIDDFKTINDTHGHDYGDAVLREAALRIHSCIGTNVLARFGGDEFIVLLSALDTSAMKAATQAEHVALKLLSVLSDEYQLENYKFTCSASIGIVLFNDDSQQESELMKQADIAMYRAKHSGKNVACFFDPEMQKEVNTLFEIENELRTAIEEKQFELFYQPQVNQLHQVVGAEALIRWQHPTKGPVTPLTFIPIAERTGLILPIGEWVLETACQQLSNWQQHPVMRDFSLSVNVSYKQFRDSGFVAIVSQLINRYPLIKGKLRLELTETMLVDDMELVIERMNELRNIGVNFSLDDFGTGYSSLKYLKKLPINQLKIDKSFIDDLVSDKNDQSIVKTIISMSETLGFNTIAEGVEKEEQRDYLETEGCLMYQGYLFSRPVPIDEFEKFSDKQRELLN